MKKSLLALAVLGAFAGVASAQSSSVTLFGIVDVSARATKNGNGLDKKLMATDGINSSRLGFRGVEDLGGGLGAAFWLEAGLAADNGTIGGGNTQGATTSGSNGAAFFNRRATVSLLGGFGELRLGRDYIPSFWNLTIYDPFGTNGVGAYTNVMPGGGAGLLLGSNIVRANNTVAYHLPGNLGGLFGQVTIAAGEGTPTTGTAATSTVTLPTPAFAGNKYSGARVGYAAGPVSVAVAFSTRNVAPVAGQDKMKSTNIGGSYNFGFATAYAQYGTFKLSPRELKNSLLGATASFGQSTVKISYATLKDNSAAVDGAKQLALGYQYDLSKRTAMYGTYSRMKNDPGAAYPQAVADPAAAAGKNYTAYEVGVRHAF